MHRDGTRRFLWWLAWRQVVAKKGKSLSVMTWISILGVSIGVAALVVVLSVMGGFAADLKDKMFRGLPHIELLAENAAVGFSLDEYPLSTFEQIIPSAVGIEPFTKADVVVKNGKNLASMVLFGIDPARGGALWGFSTALHEGSVRELLMKTGEIAGVMLGESLAVQLGVSVGDTIRILNPQTHVTNALAGGTLSLEFQVVGIFTSDLSNYDARYGVVNLEAGRKFMPDYDISLDEKHYVTGIAINLPNPEEVEQYEARLHAGTPLTISTWQTVNRSILFALKLEKYTMGCILLLIVLVAAFSISATMMMTVYHKRHQIALLRSIGFSQQSILRLFLLQGFSIGMVGVLIGLVMGVGLCVLLYYFQFVDLPIGIFSQRKLPVKFLPVEYGVISVCAWALSLLAAAYPARVAAQQDPGIGLRYL